MKDLTGKMEPEDMPLCPLCDNPIQNFEPAVLVRCGPYKGLAHQGCAEEADDEE